MNSSDNAPTGLLAAARVAAPCARKRMENAADVHNVLASDAGVPFRPPAGDADPFAEWLDLMEVVHMLCPVWAVRNAPMVGDKWRL